MAAPLDASAAEDPGMSLCGIPSPALGSWHGEGAGREAAGNAGANCVGYCFSKKQMVCRFTLVWLISEQMLGDLSVCLEMAKWSWESGGISGISYFESG